MSLLSELDDAELVVADEDLGLSVRLVRRAPGFQGARRERGNAIDAFSSSTAFSRKLTVREARAVIEAHRNELREDES